MFVSQYKPIKGAQWISGRVLDSRPKGRGFKVGSAGIGIALSYAFTQMLILVVRI